MMLKRHYRKPEGWVEQRNTRNEDGSLRVPSLPENAVINPPALDHLEVIHTGINREQNFSDRSVNAWLSAGIASFDSAGSLVIHSQPEALHYAVLRTPGVYCVHDGKRIEGDRGDGSVAREYVATRHAGAAAVPGHPAGYERIHAYECVLDAAQHAKYCFAQYDAKRKGKV